MECSHHSPRPGLLERSTTRPLNVQNCRQDTFLHLLDPQMVVAESAIVFQLLRKVHGKGMDWSCCTSTGENFFAMLIPSPGSNLKATVKERTYLIDRLERLLKIATLQGYSQLFASMTVTPGTGRRCRWATHHLVLEIPKSMAVESRKLRRGKIRRVRCEWFRKDHGDGS